MSCRHAVTTPSFVVSSRCHRCIVCRVITLSPPHRLLCCRAVTAASYVVSSRCHHPIVCCVVTRSPPIRFSYTISDIVCVHYGVELSERHVPVRSADTDSLVEIVQLSTCGLSSGRKPPGHAAPDTRVTSTLTVSYLLTHHPSNVPILCSAFRCPCDCAKADHCAVHCHLRYGSPFHWLQSLRRHTYRCISTQCSHDCRNTPTSRVCVFTSFLYFLTMMDFTPLIVWELVMFLAC